MKIRIDVGSVDITNSEIEMGLKEVYVTEGGDVTLAHRHFF